MKMGGPVIDKTQSERRIMLLKTVASGKLQPQQLITHRFRLAMQ
jgi:hypothetical protein